MKKERGIAFTTEMVQAERHGRKTQTRRLTGLKAINENPDEWKFSGWDHTHTYPPAAIFEHVSGNPHVTRRILCPYGAEGHLLYVKESCYVDNNYCPGLNRETTVVIYKADELTDYEQKLIRDGDVQAVPGRFMYKELARTWLEVVSIGVERLHDISPGNAVAEGIVPHTIHVGFYKDYDYHRRADEQRYTNARDSYLSLFRKVNPKAPPNPWVWVVTFKRVTHAQQ